MSRDDEFVNGIKQQLDQQSEALDDRTVARLRQARVAAQSDGVVQQRRWQPVAAYASIALLAVIAWIVVPISHNGEQSMAAIDDIELLASADDLEFYEDIEFYQWLEVQDEQG